MLNLPCHLLGTLLTWNYENKTLMVQNICYFFWKIYFSLEKHFLAKEGSMWKSLATFSNKWHASVFLGDFCGESILPDGTEMTLNGRPFGLFFADCSNIRVLVISSLLREKRMGEEGEGLVELAQWIFFIVWSKMAWNYQKVSWAQIPYPSQQPLIPLIEVHV